MVVLGLGLVRWRIRFGLALAHPHQLLVASAFGQPLEVSADRGAHLVEVALLAHGR